MVRRPQSVGRGLRQVVFAGAGATARAEQAGAARLSAARIGGRHGLLRIPRRPADPKHLLIVGAIVVAGVIVRWAYYGEPMRYDEGFSFLNYALLGVRPLTLTYSTPNNQILNTLFMHFEWKLFGASIYSLRLHVLIAGILSPIAGYWVGRELYDRAAGVWAAALIATSSPLIDFSVNARGYELGALFVLLTLGLAVKLVRAEGRWAGRLLVITVALAVWSVPTMAYAVVAIALWALGSRGLQRPFDLPRLLQLAGPFAMAAALGYLLYWPLIGQGGWNFIPPLPHTWSAIHPLLTGTWQLWNRTTFHPFDWLIALAFLGASALPRELAPERMPLPAALLITLAGILLFGPVSPFARSYIGMLALYLIAAAGGLSGAGWLIARRLSKRGLTGRGRLTAWTGMAAAALLLTVILGVSALRGGQLDSEEPPASDNNIVPILEQLPKPGGQVLIDEPSYGAGVSFYLAVTRRWELVSGRVTAAQRAAGHALVIVPRGQGGHVSGAISTVASLGGDPVPAEGVRLVKQLPYISIYDVPIRSA